MIRIEVRLENDQGRGVSAFVEVEDALIEDAATYGYDLPAPAFEGYQAKATVKKILGQCLEAYIPGPGIPTVRCSLSEGHSGNHDFGGADTNAR